MLRDPADRLEGDRILDESPGDLGLLLWRMALDVTLWGITPKDARGDLFADGCAESRLVLLVSAELPARASAPVVTLHAMLALPARADADTVSVCCLEVGAWARDAGLPHTAIAFAQAAALSAPAEADAALFVGICARAAGQGARAETWLRRAIAVARRERNGAAYSSALLELGMLYESRGNLLRAERFFRLTMRAARRHRERTERLRAAYALFRLIRREGDRAAAARFALAAQRLDGDVPGAADILMDVARFWTDIGEPARACAPLKRLVPALMTMEPAGQLAAFALTARAQAESGHPYSGSVAWRAAWVLLRHEELPDVARYVAAMDLAHAARASGDLRAFRAARRAALRLAPQGEYSAAAERMDKLERAS
jgi:tetratricopeptide (TPR) repeat protein